MRWRLGRRGGSMKTLPVIATPGGVAAGCSPRLWLFQSLCSCSTSFATMFPVTQASPIPPTKTVSPPGKRLRIRLSWIRADPAFGREVGDKEAGTAIGIGDDVVDLAVAEIQPQGQLPTALSVLLRRLPGPSSATGTDVSCSASSGFMKRASISDGSSADSCGCV